MAAMHPRLQIGALVVSQLKRLSGSHEAPPSAPLSLHIPFHQDLSGLTTSGSLAPNVAMLTAAERAGAAGPGATEGMAALARPDAAGGTPAAPSERRRVGVPGPRGRFGALQECLGGWRRLARQAAAPRGGAQG